MLLKAASAARPYHLGPYPPEGTRGVAGNRRSYGADDYFRRANEEVQCIALIEASLGRPLPISRGKVISQVF